MRRPNVVRLLVSRLGYAVSGIVALFSLQVGEQGKFARCWWTIVKACGPVHAKTRSGSCRNCDPPPANPWLVTAARSGSAKPVLGVGVFLHTLPMNNQSHAPAHSITRDLPGKHTLSLTPQRFQDPDDGRSRQHIAGAFSRTRPGENAEQRSVAPARRSLTVSSWPHRSAR